MRRVRPFVLPRLSPKQMRKVRRVEGKVGFRKHYGEAARDEE
jgi:hypothetical protein